MWYKWTQWDKKYRKSFQEMPEWECFPLEINRWQVYDLNVLKSTVLLGNPWEIMRNHSLTFNCPVSKIATAFSQPYLPSGQGKNIPKNLKKKKNFYQFHFLNTNEYF